MSSVPAQAGRRGLSPSETAFLSEMEMVTVIPRQRLDGLELLGGPTPPLIPPHRSTLPVWLALLLRRQKRANIVPPAWMEIDALVSILEVESEGVKLSGGQMDDEMNMSQSVGFSQPFPAPSGIDPTTGQKKSTAPAGFSAAPKLHRLPSSLTDSHDVFQSSEPAVNPSVLSPPFVVSSVAAGTGGGHGGKPRPDDRVARLPFHWLELASLLLTHAAEDFPDPDSARRLIRDLRDVRQAKLRAGLDVLDTIALGGNGVSINGVGGLEMVEARGLITGMVDGLAKLAVNRPNQRNPAGSQYPDSSVNDSQFSSRPPGSGFEAVRQRRDDSDDDGL